MPFDFLRRRKGEAPGPAGADARGTSPTAQRRRTIGEPATPGVASDKGVRFDGLTEDWRLSGTMHVEGRLSDALNRQIGRASCRERV